MNPPQTEGAVREAEVRYGKWVDYEKLPGGSLGPGLEAFFRAQEELERRFEKAIGALEGAGIRYAVIGGKAVEEHVARVDGSAVRSTPNVDLLMETVEGAKMPLAVAGFEFRQIDGRLLFMDTPSWRSAVQVFIAGQKVRPEYLEAAPELEVIERAQRGFWVLPLVQLVVMKLTSNRTIDKVHLRDMIEVGLLPGSIMAKLRPEFQERLQYLLDHPE